MFRDTANPLQRMVDSGTQFVDEADANTDDTITCSTPGRPCCGPRQTTRRTSGRFAKDLADLTGTLETSDKDIRTLLQGGPGAVREVDALLKGLEPTLPVFLSNLVTVNQVLTTNIPALRADAGPLPARDRGRLHRDARRRLRPHQPAVQQQRASVHQGLQADPQWRPATDERDGPVYPAQCKAGRTAGVRGYRDVAHFGSAASSGQSYRVAPYDARTGAVDSGDGTGRSGDGKQGGLHTVFGDDSWRWMLTGPVGGSSDAISDHGGRTIEHLVASRQHRAHGLAARAGRRRRVLLRG